MKLSDEERARVLQGAEEDIRALETVALRLAKGLRSTTLPDSRRVQKLVVLVSAIEEIIDIRTIPLLAAVAIEMLSQVEHG